LSRKATSFVHNFPVSTSCQGREFL
jgi:hypothetical protein